MHNRYFIEFQFNGTNFHGWQKQPNTRTVQSELNEKLGILLKVPIDTTGAGRTDAGVHARYFVAHFDTSENIENKLQLLTDKLNCFLPEDIFIFSIKPVKPAAHARFDALSRTYKYYISTRRDVFTRDFHWQFNGDLDISLMQKGTDLIKQYKDFTSFSKLHSDNKTNICHIQEARWDKNDHLLVFTIKADRFLRNMVRSIVGTLVLLGRNKITMNELTRIIEAKNRSDAGESVPAKGLFLHGIEYPYSI